MEKTFDCKFTKGTEVFMASSTTVFPIESHLDVKTMHNANVLFFFIWAFPFTKVRGQDLCPFVQ